MPKSGLELLLSLMATANQTSSLEDDLSDELWNFSSEENEPNSFKPVTDFISTLSTFPTPLSPTTSPINNASQVPPEYMQMSTNSRNVVIAYLIIFLISSSGNLFVFLSVCRQLGKLKWRMTILIVHLSVADLIVTFCVIPSEIVWRMTVQWYGGDLLCKLCQFCRAFGLYLSSMVLICISLDRFFAILYPLKMFEATRRVKGMLAVAWFCAVLFSVPQSIVFSVQPHPIHVTFRQCVSYSLSPQQELLYNIASLSAMYFVPLAVIIFTYSMILWKISQKSREHHQARLERKETVSSTSSAAAAAAAVVGRSRMYLRSSTDAATMMARARCRTLRLTFIIVLVFVLCWTPYTVMTLWYMFDRESAKRVDVRIQDGLFMMVVANSCLNPLVYGNYARETQSISTLCWRCGSQVRPKYKLPITSVI